MCADLIFKAHSCSGLFFLSRHISLSFKIPNCLTFLLNSPWNFLFFNFKIEFFLNRCIKIIFKYLSNFGKVFKKIKAFYSNINNFHVVHPLKISCSSRYSKLILHFLSLQSFSFYIIIY